MHQIAAELKPSYSGVELRIRLLKRRDATHTKENKKGDFWSVEEHALLLEKFEQGLTPLKITTFLPGRTISAVKNRLLRVRAATYGHKEPQGNLK